jgi:outer membrane immunogenic protein
MRQFSILAAALGLASLATGSAFAADAFRPVAAPSAAYWNGGYVGVQAGYAWDDAPFVAAGETDPLDTIHLRGGQAGGRIGMDMQSGNWVFGGLFDISGANISANVTDIGGSGSNVSAKADMVGSARLRLGLARGNWLLYGSGGFGIAKVNATVTNLAPGDLGGASASETFTGWTAGLGTELALTGDMTFGLEWLYADYGTKNFHFDDGVGTIDASTHLKGNTVLASLNWRLR